VAVGVIPVGVLTIIMGLTLTVIIVGRPIIRSTRIVATVGIPFVYLLPPAVIYVLHVHSWGKGDLIRPEDFRIKPELSVKE
jgi:hypothetical protein